MPIQAECACGKVYRVKDELAGKRFRCGSCSKAVTVPQEDEEPLDVELAEEDPPPRRRSRAPDDDERPAKRGIAARRKPVDDEEEEEDRPRRPMRVRKEEPEEEPERPKKKKKKRRRSSDDSGGGGWSGPSMTLGATLGGLLMMVGAVAWFVAGLMNDIIFFYPPVLFILGLVSFFKGLTGQD